LLRSVGGGRDDAFGVPVRIGDGGHCMYLHLAVGDGLSLTPDRHRGSAWERRIEVECWSSRCYYARRALASGAGGICRGWVLSA
jgi:hypothetical protein